MKIIQITLLNNYDYIVIENSIDEACKKLLKYLDEKDLYFAFERTIKNIEIIAIAVNIECHENVYKVF